MEAVKESPKQTGPVLGILLAVSVCHLLNDTMQAVLPAIYPMLKQSFHLSFGQIGLITLGLQLTASLLQPLVGIYTDRRPLPFSLAGGMGLTLLGMVALAVAGNYYWLLAAAVLVGLGSSVFHPEASRIARYASGGKHGFAQSLFQVGGNAGTSLGPLLAALIVVPYGLAHAAWFTLAAGLGIVILLRVGRWYRGVLVRHAAETRAETAVASTTLPRRKIVAAIVILMTLIFSKYFYLASMTSYYTFYLIHKFGVSKEAAPVYLPWRRARSSADRSATASGASA
jgi:FSR family fosmidomycin resistance protein-like MFS transporter